MKVWCRFKENLLFQFLLLLLFSLLFGFGRQYFPQGISWFGQWPTSSTSTEDAYRMIAREGDPEFVSLAEVIQIQKDQSSFIIDARTSQEFTIGRIPHSRNLPFYEMEKFQNDAMKGIDTDDAIIIYCEGVGCELSFFLGREFQTQGYQNVRIFYGGYPEWKNAGLPIEK
ncbi:MAG: rhodanese-like domain-containing protein [Elusimicrobiota bacterium]